MDYLEVENPIVEVQSLDPSQQEDEQEGLEEPIEEDEIEEDASQVQESAADEREN